MQRRIHLLIIDPQNDFCDLPPEYLPADPHAPGAHFSPALPVPGAHEDMLRLAELVRRGRPGWSEITVTLDSHHFLGIERPAFWMQGNGSPVAPFTPITAAALRAGRFVPRDSRASDRVLAYVDALETAGRYTLMVWPTHCEIGTWGHNVHADLRRAYNEWEAHTLGIVGKVAKGSNPWTEHYSALMAEVPDPADPATHLNRGLIESLRAADLVLIAGEAGSHCVKATVEHIADHFGRENLARLVLLTDCMSPVSGFEAQYRGFVAEMRARGLQMARSTEVLPEVIANGRR